MYVIGGIVDRTRTKNMTFDKASQHSIITARLPLKEHVATKGDRVLTLVAVFNMLHEVAAHGDWKAAIDKSLAKRYKLPALDPATDTPADASTGTTKDDAISEDEEEEADT